MQEGLSRQESVSEQLNRTIDQLRKTNANFENAFDTYTQEYGREKLNLGNEPTNIAQTVDPVAIALGRNCVVFYSDSNSVLHGPLGTIDLRKAKVCIIGRRQPQDSKLVAWTVDQETDLQDYNSRTSTIPSRIHASIVFLNEKEVMFSDLGSSSGTVLVGESVQSGPFVKIYDPSPPNFPNIKVERISTAKS